MRPTSLIAAALLLSTLAGCHFGKPSGTKLAGTGMDMFTPVKMRLHPLSRIITTPPVAEARLEFTDQFNDIGKGVGTAIFDLYAYDTLSFNHKGKSLGQWPGDLATPAENASHWDAITRTYLFKLPIAPGNLTGHSKFLLIATFTLPNGQELTDDITLPSK
jgi:hypothetical protein